VKKVRSDRSPVNRNYSRRPGSINVSIVDDESMPGVQSFKLFIGNLDENTKAAEIRALFEKYAVQGKIIECDVVKNYGFVHYQNESDAREAIANLNGYVINGNAIKVENAKSRRSANANTSIFSQTLTLIIKLSYNLISLSYKFIRNLASPPPPSPLDDRLESCENIRGQLDGKDESQRRAYIIREIWRSPRVRRDSKLRICAFRSER
jgi:RNA recognition motif-containing protein